MPVVVSGSGAIPSSVTASEMIRYVLDYVQGSDEPHLRDVALRAINRSLDRINTVRWQKIVGYQDITFVASTQTYDLASDVKEPQTFMLLDSSDNLCRRLPFKEMGVMDWEHQVVSGTGYPQCYTLDYGQHQLRLERSPSSAFVAAYPTGRLRYYRRLAHLTQDSDQLGIPADFDWFIGWSGRADMAAARGERAAASDAQREAREAWATLRQNDFDTQPDYD